MGLPGSGKTTLAKELLECMKDSGTVWYNADDVRFFVERKIASSTKNASPRDEF
jgi:adenylate kinase family enzyme